MGEPCFACSGNGFNCRLCGGTGIREGTALSTRQSFNDSNARSAYLWVRCGVDRDLSFGRNSSDNTPEMAMKRPLSSRELKALRDLLDHRQNSRLQLRKRA